MSERSSRRNRPHGKMDASVSRLNHREINASAHIAAARIAAAKRLMSATRGLPPVFIP